MADRDTINACVMDLAEAYGMHDTRAAKTRAAWGKHLAEVSNRTMEQVTQKWIRQEEKAPTIAAMLDACRQHELGIGTRVDTIQGCEECQWSGERQMAWWRNANSAPEPTVYTYAAACDCLKGKHLECPFRPNWRDLGRRWKHDPTTVDIFWTSAQKPCLPAHERLPPTAAQRVKTRRPPAWVARRWAERMMGETDVHATRRASQGVPE